MMRRARELALAEGKEKPRLSTSGKREQSCLSRWTRNGRYGSQSTKLLGSGKPRPMPLVGRSLISFSDRKDDTADINRTACSKVLLLAPLLDMDIEAEVKPLD